MHNAAATTAAALCIDKSQSMGRHAAWREPAVGRADCRHASPICAVICRRRAQSSAFVLALLQ